MDVRFGEQSDYADTLECLHVLSSEFRSNQTEWGNKNTNTHGKQGQSEM